MSFESYVLGRIEIEWMFRELERLEREEEEEEEE